MSTVGMYPHIYSHNSITNKANYKLLIITNFQMNTADTCNSIIYKANQCNQL